MTEPFGYDHRKEVMMRGARGSITARVVVTGALIMTVGALAAVPSISIAAPSQEEVASAKEKLLTLQREFEVVVERYNTARYNLSLNESRLAESRTKMQAAKADARVALDRLADRAVAAYTGMGSQVNGLLDATSVAEFSDRLEFMGAVTSSDAEIATAAENARQEAQWAAEDYRAAVEVSEGRLQAMSRDRAEIERLLDE